MRHPNMYAFIQMCQHKGKCTCTLYLCPCQMRLQIILSARVQEADSPPICVMTSYLTLALTLCVC